MAASSKKGEALPAIDSVLSTLRERRKKLDEADTLLSEKIREAEGLLQDHFNIRVWTCIASDSDPDGVNTKLVFGKHDGKWQLLIEVDGFTEDYTVTPLLSSSREMRMRVFLQGGLESLVRGAVKQLDDQLEMREQALDKATKLVGDLGGIPF